MPYKSLKELSQPQEVPTAVAPKGPEGSFTGDVLRLLLGQGVRVAAPILGGLAGAATANPLGIAAGAAAGGAAGEYAAEKWIDPMSDGNVNYGKVGLQGAISAIPGAALVKAGRPLASGVIGAGLGYAQTAGNKLAEGESLNNAVNPFQWERSDLIGPALGAAGGAAFGAVARAHAGPGAPPPPKPLSEADLMAKVDELRKTTGPTTPEELALQREIDKHTLNNPSGQVALKIFKKGRPNVMNGEQQTAPIVEQEKIYNKAMQDDARQQALVNKRGDQAKTRTLSALDKRFQRAVARNDRVAEAADTAKAAKEAADKKIYLDHEAALAEDKKRFQATQNEAARDINLQKQLFEDAAVERAKKIREIESTGENLAAIDPSRIVAQAVDKAHPQALADNERFNTAREKARRAMEVTYAKAKDEDTQRTIDEIQGIQKEFSTGVNQKNKNLDALAKSEAEAKRQAFINEQKVGKEAVVGTPTESITGIPNKGENAGTENVSVRYVEPPPPEGEEGGLSSGPVKPTASGPDGQRPVDNPDWEMRVHTKADGLKIMREHGLPPEEFNVFPVNKEDDPESAGQFIVRRKLGRFADADPETRARILKEAMSGKKGPEPLPEIKHNFGANENTPPEVVQKLKDFSRSVFRNKAQAGTIAEALGGKVVPYGRGYIVELPETFLNDMNGPAYDVHTQDKVATPVPGREAGQPIPDNGWARNDGLNPASRQAQEPPLTVHKMDSQAPAIVNPREAQINEIMQHGTEKGIITNPDEFKTGLDGLSDEELADLHSQFTAPDEPQGIVPNEGVKPAPPVLEPEAQAIRDQTEPLPKPELTPKQFGQAITKEGDKPIAKVPFQKGPIPTGDMTGSPLFGGAESGDLLAEPTKPLDFDAAKNKQTNSKLMDGMDSLTDEDIAHLDSFDDFGNKLSKADRGLEEPVEPKPTAPVKDEGPKPPKLKTRQLNDEFANALAPVKGSDGKWYFVDRRQPNYNHITRLDPDGFPRTVRGFYGGAGFYRDEIPEVKFTGTYEEQPGYKDPTSPTEEEYKAQRDSFNPSKKKLPQERQAIVNALRGENGPALFEEITGKPVGNFTPHQLARILEAGNSKKYGAAADTVGSRLIKGAEIIPPPAQAETKPELTPDERKSANRRLGNEKRRRDEKAPLLDKTGAIPPPPTVDQYAADTKARGEAFTKQQTESAANDKAKIEEYKKVIRDAGGDPDAVIAGMHRAIKENPTYILDTLGQHIRSIGGTYEWTPEGVKVSGSAPKVEATAPAPKKSVLPVAQPKAKPTATSPREGLKQLEAAKQLGPLRNKLVERGLAPREIDAIEDTGGFEPVKIAQALQDKLNELDQVKTQAPTESTQPDLASLVAKAKETGEAYGKVKGEKGPHVRDAGKAASDAHKALVAAKPSLDDIASMDPVQQSRILADIFRTQVDDPSILNGIVKRAKLKDQKGAAGIGAVIRIGSGLAGGAIGATQTPDDPIKGAIIGGAAGLVAPSLIKAAIAQVGRNPQSVDKADMDVLANKVRNWMKAAGELIPEIQRANLLANAVNLPINTVVGPFGSTLMNAIEQTLLGDERGPKLIKELFNPKKYGKELFKAAFDEAKLRIADPATRTEGQVSKAGPEWLRKVTSVPAELLTAGDTVAKNFVTDAGFSAEQAKDFTMTNEPKTGISQAIGNFKRGAVTKGGKKSVVAQMMLPFWKTAANQMERSAERTPILGFLAQKAKDVPDTIKHQILQQVGGGVVEYGAFQLGKEFADADPTDPRLRAIRKGLNEFFGPYGTGVSVAFTMGMSYGKHGDMLKAVGSGVGRLATGDVPLPTPQPLTDVFTKAKHFYDTGDIKLPGGVIPQFLDWTSSTSVPSLINMMMKKEEE